MLTCIPQLHHTCICKLEQHSMGNVAFFLLVVRNVQICLLAGWQEARRSWPEYIIKSRNSFTNCFHVDRYLSSVEFCGRVTIIHCTSRHCKISLARMHVSEVRTRESTVDCLYVNVTHQSTCLTNDAPDSSVLYNVKHIVQDPLTCVLRQPLASRGRRISLLSDLILIFHLHGYRVYLTCSIFSQNRSSQEL